MAFWAVLTASDARKGLSGPGKIPKHIAPDVPCPDQTLINQFGASRESFMAILDSFWPYNGSKWLDQSGHFGHVVIVTVTGDHKL